jgi:hypothetical protein
MTQRPRSALLYELTRPVPRPRVIIPEGPVSTAAFANNVEARHIPFSIVPNSDFVSQLLDYFRYFCEHHPDRGNDPDRLACIRLARDDCRLSVIESDADGVSLLLGTVFASVRRALHDLEKTTGASSVIFGRERFEVAIGSRATGLWLDNMRDYVGPVRVVWQQTSPQEATRFFQDMDDTAQDRVNFNPRATAFEGADSIIVKVRTCFCHRGYKLMCLFQGAVEASFRSSRYVIYHSGFDMIVHRLMPLSQNRYYLEASPRIPIDSQSYPHMAVLAAIIFDARFRNPAAPLDAVPFSVDKYYNGLNRKSRTVRSSSQSNAIFRPFC